MISKFSLDKIKTLFESLHNLTNRHLALYDGEYKLILEFPSKRCEFCDLLRSDKRMNVRCSRSISDAMKQCCTTGNTVIFRCHAELVEIVIPLKAEHDKITGYVVFGQLMFSDNVDNQYKNIRLHACDTSCNADVFNDALENVDKVDRTYLFDIIKVIANTIQSVFYEHILKYKNKDVWYKINEYIYMNFDKNISLDIIAEQLSVSVQTLCRTAKQYSGKTVGELIAEKRIEKAKYYLENTAVQISSISKNIGIEDNSYFSRFFKKHTGMSPIDWRSKFTSV